LKAWEIVEESRFLDDPDIMLNRLAPADVLSALAGAGPLSCRDAPNSPRTNPVAGLLRRQVRHLTRWAGRIATTPSRRAWQAVRDADAGIAALLGRLTGSTEADRHAAALALLELSRAVIRAVRLHDAAASPPLLRALLDRQVDRLRPLDFQALRDGMLSVHAKARLIGVLKAVCHPDELPAALHLLTLTEASIDGTLAHRSLLQARADLRRATDNIHGRAIALALAALAVAVSAAFGGEDPGLRATDIGREVGDAMKALRQGLADGRELDVAAFSRLPEQAVCALRQAQCRSPMWLSRLMALDAKALEAAIHAKQEMLWAHVDTACRRLWNTSGRSRRHAVVDELRHLVVTVERLHRFAEDSGADFLHEQRSRVALAMQSALAPLQAVGAELDARPANWLREVHLLRVRMRSCDIDPTAPIPGRLTCRPGIDLRASIRAPRVSGLPERIADRAAPDTD
jgi:hypothetical protein